MPFNSTLNNYHSNPYHEKSFQHIRNDYDYQYSDDLTTLNRPSLVYGPRRSHELNDAPQDDYNDYEDELTGGRGRNTIGRFFKRLGRKITHTGYDIKNNIVHDANVVAKSATDKNGLVHAIIKSANDVIIPVLGTAVGTALGNPALGGIVGKIGRKTLEKQTGYGKKPDTMELSNIIKKYVPNYTKDVKEVSKEETKPKKSISARNVLVKKVMAQHPEFSMPQASKYIKENNLY